MFGQGPFVEVFFMEKQDKDKVQVQDKKKHSYLKEWLVFLFLLGLYIAFQTYRGAKSPALTAYGIKDWQTVCEGKGRIYRLKSQNLSQVRGSYSEKTVTKRDLQFLDEEGKILYETAFFDPKSLDKDEVWRFQYRGGEKLADRMFRKTEKYPFFQKILSKLFQADWKRYKDKDIGKALYGDEKTFEIAKNLTAISLTLQSGKTLSLTCKP